MKKTLSALVVDDEALARSNLQLALADHPGWRCVGACAGAAEARVALAQREVDLLLLDIQMPRQNGLNFAAELQAAATPQKPAPLIVFVTAFDEHALSAFDVFALDYLLKPFDDQRFAAMLARAEQVLALKQSAAHAMAYATTYADAMGSFLKEQSQVAAGQPYPALDFLTVRSVGSVERVAVADIEWIAAAGNYVELHLKTASGSNPRVVLHRSTLSALELRLPSQQFMRVHRTALVRPAAMSRMEVTGDSTYELTLTSGDKVPVSERFAKEVRAVFNKA
ncbi:LytR/AlgR family response regulator transcription factor [Paucibacter sp. Y2R2-4]|uniref:LytR/AlgR family response regulator transcription factor n=1 Tax=Paucibacter sp. Y2R2-4 TaxID=2893553 RepID=UPI0021E44ACF|nr:LytTR family DNA-binding domain-containing protein [Paucibacter sp. Y2R2-4]MCV2352412.1 LytTR family DNA-binding domain-containing protein [Paucibacter sp. Y2R2-4]